MIKNLTKIDVLWPSIYLPGQNTAADETLNDRTFAGALAADNNDLWKLYGVGTNSIKNILSSLEVQTTS